MKKDLVLSLILNKNINVGKVSAWNRAKRRKVCTLATPILICYEVAQLLSVI